MAGKASDRTPLEGAFNGGVTTIRKLTSLLIVSMRVIFMVVLKVIVVDNGDLS